VDGLAGRLGLRTAPLATMAHSPVSEAVGSRPGFPSNGSALAIAVSDICVRCLVKFAHDSNGPALICVRISKRPNYNYIFSNEQFGSVFALA
jgi:hypothetical protein